MGKRIVIDPIPRIEGHLGIEIEVEDGKVKDAWASGTLFRGFEIILKNRDPRDAWLLTQRICGVCPTSHAHTSAMCIEDSYKIRPPDRDLNSSIPISCGSITLQVLTMWMSSAPSLQNRLSSI